MSTARGGGKGEAVSSSGLGTEFKFQIQGTRMIRFSLGQLGGDDAEVGQTLVDLTALHQANASRLRVGRTLCARQID